MENKKIKIIVKGAYGDANVGDDLLLTMVLQILSKLKFKPEITVVCNKVKYLTKAFSDIKFVSLTKSRFIDSDAYILGGGTQFFSFQNSNSKLSLTSKFLIYLNILANEPSLLYYYFKSKFIRINENQLRLAIGIGLGPFSSENDEILIKNDLKYFDHLYGRDTITLDYITKWELQNSSFSADLCLTSIFHQLYHQKHQLISNNKPKLGVVLRDWPHNNVGKIINDKIINWIDENSNYEISVFLFSKEKDQALADFFSYKSNLKIDNLIIWHPEDYDFNEFYSLLNGCDVIITSRYHAAIFALNLEIPTICLGIDPKLKALCQEVDGYYYWDANKDVSEIDTQLMFIKSNYIDLQSSIKKSYLKLNKRANAMVDDVVVRLNKLTK